MKMKPGFLFFIIMQISTCFVTEGLTFTRQPTSATGIQGQSVTITWIADLGAGETWTNVRVNQEDPSEKAMILFLNTGVRYVYPDYSSRDADLNLTVSHNGTLLTSVLTMRNLNQSTDEHLYALRITYDVQVGPTTTPDSLNSADLQLTVHVPPTITSPNPSPATVTVNKTQTAQLECTATGHPTPDYNWTRNGVIVGTGSPITTTAVTYDDDKACYTCVAYNGIPDVKTANVCLNVQYKPRSTLSLGSTKSTVCQNDKVNLTCTSGPANPAPSSYEFYDNDVLVGTSASNVYEATATVGLPAVNKFVCVPRNLLGPALENASVEVTAKVVPAIVTSPQATTLVEGNALTLFCNASGVPAPSITWTKVGGSTVGNVNSETYTISSVTRGHEGTYRCTASNGDECGSATAEANIVVNSAPNISNIIITEDSLTVSWGNLLLPQKARATCWINAMETFHDANWMTSSNISNGSSISCSISGLQPSTLYRIQHALKILENYVNGTIYIGTSARAVGSNHSTCNCGETRNISSGVSFTVFIVVIAAAAAIIVLLISVVVWMRFQGLQKSKSTNSEEKNKTESALQDSETVYENEGFIFRKSRTDGDIAFYEQVQNRGLVRNQAVGGTNFFAMEIIPGNLEGGTTAAENQAQSKYEEPYQSVDPREMEAAKRLDDNQGSYGHLMGFTRRPAPNTTASSQDQNPYQELQPAKHYQSLQNMQRSAFNI